MQAPREPRYVRHHFAPGGQTRRDRRVRAHVRRLLLARYPNLVLPRELRRKGDPR